MRCEGVRLANFLNMNVSEDLYTAYAPSSAARAPRARSGQLHRATTKPVSCSCCAACGGDGGDGGGGGGGDGGDWWWWWW